MPLTRYKIRNEYSLADPELYRAADKDDPEALLEGVAMAGLVGVLRQLGDLAEFAAEIFHNLHEEVMVTAARGHGLMVRVQQLEAEFPLIEKALLSQTSHSLFFYNNGVEWHPNMRMERNLVTQGDLPRFVMDSYEECRGPPRLFLLDKFDVAGAGACLKRYTDPSFFKLGSSSSEITNADVQRDKKTRKAKKKGSRWRNGQTPEVLPKSQAKLHQLFLEESVENHLNDPAHRVKLKRRLNGFPFDSKTGKSYMEKFLETPAPDHNVVHDISVNSSPLKLPVNINGESGREILEISTGSPEKHFSQRKRSTYLTPDAEESGGKQPIYQLNEEIDYGISVVSKRNPISEAENALSVLYEDLDEKEMEGDRERKIEGSEDGYRSDDVASEIDNYLDALTTMDSEMETDTESKAKNDVRILNISSQGMDSGANEEQQDLQARFSDSQSIGNSAATDEGNSSSRKEISSLSCSDSVGDLAENAPSDGHGSDKILPSTGICEAEIVSMSSDQLSLDGDAPLTQAPEHMVFNDVYIEEADIRRSEYGEPSYSSCLTDSTRMLLPVDREKSLEEGASMGPKSGEISSDHKELKTGYTNPGEDTAYLGDNLPWISNRSNDPSQARDNFLSEMSSENRSLDGLNDENAHILSHASQHHSSVLDESDDMLQVEDAEAECPKISVDSQMDSSHSAASLILEQHLDSASAEVETCDPDIKPDGMIFERDDALLVSGVRAISSIPTVSSENVPPLELDPVEEASSYCGEKNLGGNYKATDGEELGEFSPKMDKFGEFASNIKFPSEFQSSADPPVVPDGHLDVVTEPEYSEAVIVAAGGTGTCSDVNGDDEKSLSTSPKKAQEESISFLQGLHDSVMETNEVFSPEHLQESATEKEVDNQAVSSDLDNCDDSSTQLLNNVLDSLTAAISGNSLQIADTSPVPLSSDQDNQGSESKSAQQVIVIENADDAVSSPTHHIAELNPSLEQKIQLQDDQFDVESQRDQDPETESSQQVVVMENSDAAVSLPTHLVAEPKPPVEQEVELQDDQFDVESQRDGDPETNSSQQVVVIENSDAAVSSPTHHIAEPKPPVEQEVESQDDQFDVEYQHGQDSETTSSQQIEVIDDAEVAVSSPTPRIAGLRNHFDQNVKLPDDLIDVQSEHDQDSETKSSQQIEAIDDAEVAVSSPTPHIGGLQKDFKQNVELQNDRYEVESHQSDKASSEPISMVEQIQSSNYLDQERHNDAPSKFYAAHPPSQPRVSEFFPQRDVSEQANDLSSSNFPSFGIIPAVSQLNLDEMPPLPPLPPMQWRIGKVQHASLASQRDLAGHNLDSFPPILPSTSYANTQSGHIAIEGEITQPSNPFLPESALEDENSRHGYENIAGYVVRPDSLPLQVSMLGNHNSTEEGFPTADRTQSSNPFERPEHGFLASEGTTAQPSVNPFSPVTLGEDTVSTSLHQSVPETRSENEKLQGTSAISAADATIPHLTMEDDQPKHLFSTSEVQIALYSSAPLTLPPFEEDGKPNGNLQVKLPRPRNPLIDAVVALDKSKLRKVTERVRPDVEQKIEERDSLLEQIRTKSFNLKPATSARPSVQGPKTNLKVAAILEKANAIRQAFAGSDEDDDENSWSDS